MKDAKDFDVNEFIPEDSTNGTIATGSTRQSKLSVSSEQSELTERNGIAGQTSHTPRSEGVEKTVPIVASEQTRPVEEISSTSSNGQTEKPQRAISTSVTVQSMPGHQATSAQTIEQVQSTPTSPSRVSSRQRRASLDEYREIFLPVPKITDRQPVFVSRDIRDKIDNVVRRLGERKMSVSGFLENLARHHFDMYTDDLEQWKRL